MERPRDERHLRPPRGPLVSVSLATVEFRPTNGGAAPQLTDTEDGAYVDGLDDAALRTNGTGGMLGSGASLFVDHT